MLKFFNQKGQSAVEYTAIMVIVLGALVAMGSYMKRGVQGRWKESADNLGDQYDPRYADSDIRHILVQNSETQIQTVEDAGVGYWTFRQDNTNSISTKTGTISAGAY